MDDVKRHSTHLKTLFFLFFIGLGICSPYFGIYYKHVIVHADGTPAIGLIGLIFFVMPLVSLIANIPAGILADKFRSGQHLITVFCLGVALFAALIGLAGEDFARPLGMGGRFVLIFVLLFLLHGCFYPISPMIDAETLQFLNRHSRRELYGTYRLWGTYGWSLSTILVGGCLFLFPHDPLIFYSASLAFALMGIAAWSGIEGKPAAQPIRIPWNHLRRDRLFQGFLIFIFLVGVVSNASYLYTGYFFDDVMKTPLEIGIILGTWTIFEVPVMFFSRRLIDTLGNRWLIISGLFLNGIRMILFSLFTLETPYLWKWGAALLQGPGFGMLQLGIIDFVDRRAHPEMRATYMNIANVARSSLASAVGGVMGSWLIGKWGGASLMLACGCGSVVLILWFGLLISHHGHRGKRFLTP